MGTLNSMSGVGALLCGLALLLLERRARPLAVALAVLVFLCLLIPVVPYLTTRGVGLSPLTFPPNPNRVLPTAALGLLLAAFSLILAGTSGRDRSGSDLLVMALGVVVLAIGLFPLITSERVPMLGGGSLTPMSALAAACLVALGAGLILFPWTQLPGGSRTLPLWLAVSPGLVVAVLSLLLAGTLNQDQESNLKNDSRVVLGDLATQFQDEMDQMGSVMDEVAAQFVTDSPETSAPNEWIAQQFMNLKTRFPSSLRLVLVSRAGPGWIAHAQDGREYSVPEEEVLTFERESASGSIASFWQTGQLELIRFLEDASEDRIAGYVAWTLETRESFWKVINSHSRGYQASVFWNGIELYPTGAPSSSAPLQFSVSLPVEALGQSLELSLVPRPAVLQQFLQPLPVVSAILGLALALLISVSIFHWQVHRGDVMVMKGLNSNLNREIQERIQFEEELTKSQRVLAHAGRLARMGSLEWDLETDRMHPSEELSELLDLPRETALFLPQFLDRIHPADRQALEETLTAARSNGNAFESRVRVAGSRERILQVRGTLAGQGKSQVMILALLDTTAQTQREEELAELTEELARSNRELRNFAYAASHDLQEPLRKVRAFGQRLERHLTDLDPTGRDYLNRMTDAAGRMQTLIEDLLQLSRLATKSPSFGPVDLNSLLERVVEDLEERVRETGGRVEAAPLPTIRADSSQMRQLFQNLIGNALKFHRPKESPLVQVTARPTKAPPGHANGEDLTWWLFEVEDNGIGFDPQYRDRVFRAFERLHGRGVYEGTGIGLAICERVVTHHRGVIDLESEPGEGTTFRVWLPSEPDRVPRNDN